MRRIDEVQRQEYPEPGRHVTSVLVPIADELLGDTRLQLLVLMAAAAAVLLIACANLASLLLSRAAGRRGELAVRAALGATRGRLVRQIVVEATMFSLLGGLMGLALAPSARGDGHLTPRRRRDERSSDLRLLAFAFACRSRRVVFRVVPALQAARASLQDALPASSRSAVGGRNRLTRDTLVVLQIAAALVLLAGTGLMIRTMANLRAIEIGFRPDRMLTMRTTLPNPKYRGARAAAGVLRARDCRARPARGGTCRLRVHAAVHRAGKHVLVPSRAKREVRTDQQDTLFRVGTRDYLKPLGVQLIEGRLIDERDGVDAPRAVVINETLARKYFPRIADLAADSAGRRPGSLYTIVGVVKDVRERGHTLAQKPGVYLTNAQGPGRPFRNISCCGRRGTCRYRRVGSSCDRRRRSRAAGHGSAIDGRDCGSAGRRSPTADGVARRVRGARARAGVTRVVRPARLRRGAARSREWTPHRPRRDRGIRDAGRGQPPAGAHGIGLSIGLALTWAATRALQNVVCSVTAGDPSTYVAMMGC